MTGSASGGPGDTPSYTGSGIIGPGLLLGLLALFIGWGLVLAGRRRQATAQVTSGGSQRRDRTVT